MYTLKWLTTCVLFSRWTTNTCLTMENILNRSLHLLFRVIRVLNEIIADNISIKINILNNIILNNIYFYKHSTLYNSSLNKYYLFDNFHQSFLNYHIKNENWNYLFKVVVDKYAITTTTITTIKTVVLYLPSTPTSYVLSYIL
jgi:hypothetical protein